MLDIVAGGRGGWSGWLELVRSPMDETAMRMTAEVVRDVGADVTGVVGAEKRRGAPRGLGPRGALGRPRPVTGGAVR